MYKINNKFKNKEVDFMLDIIIKISSFILITFLTIRVIQDAVGIIFANNKEVILKVYVIDLIIALIEIPIFSIIISRGYSAILLIIFIVIKVVMQVFRK